LYAVAAAQSGIDVIGDALELGAIGLVVFELGVDTLADTVVTVVDEQAASMLADGCHGRALTEPSR